MTGWEVAAALLTAVGLASLGWLAVGWLVSPGRPERDVKVYAVLRAAGDGEELEQAARRRAGWRAAPAGCPSSLPTTA